LASVAHVSGFAYDSQTQGWIRNAAAACAHQTFVADNALAGRLNAAASVAYLSLRADHALAYHDADAVGIAQTGGTVRAVYRITFSFDAFLSGRAGNAGAGVLRAGRIDSTPHECQQDNRYKNS